MNPLRAVRTAAWIIGLALAVTGLRAADLPALERELLPRAKAGEAEAQYRLGQLYAMSSELRFYQPKQAERWLREAADQDHLGATLQLVELYLFAPELGADAGDIAPYLERAAALGHTRSATHLGMLLWMGERGLPMNRARALDLLRASALRGDDVAVLALASHALDGVGLARDPTKARELLAYAARGGSLRARQQLKLLEPDARRLARPAEVASRLAAQARQGDAEAKLILALSQLSDPSIIAEDPDANLEQRVARSRELLEQAAALGQAEASTRLGIILANGQGVAPDAVAAAAQFERAASADPLARLNLAVLMLDGKLPRADTTRIVPLLESASSENRDAAFELGMVFYEGRLRPRDLTQAAKLFGQAAARGQAKALVNLGVMAFNGEAGPADPVTAARWWFLAAVAGDAQGSAMLQRVWPRLSAADRRAAGDQVRQWTRSQLQVRAADFPVLAVR